MLTIILWAIGAILALLALMPVLATLRFRRYVRQEMGSDRPPFTPKLSVILPCKGIDPGFDQNVRSLLDQEYPDFEVLFVTATALDPAYARLSELTAGRPDCTVLVAGIREGRSQKLNNQLRALRRVRRETEALVFVDSDVRLHPAFLRDLVRPLADDGVGATTGFRWYVPRTGGIGSYVRAAWNGGGLPMLAHQRTAYAWGGAMACMSDTFGRAGVRERWESALTDDFPLTEAIKELGLTVRFVPQCLVASHEDSTPRETIEWTNRQTVICRVYYPSLWKAILCMHAVHAVAVVLAIALIALNIVEPGRIVPVWPAALMLGAPAMEVVAGAALWQTVRRLIPQIGGWREAAKHLLVTPLAILLICANSLHSMFTRTIRWRGVCYRLCSPTRTEVLGALGKAGNQKA